MDNQKEIYIPCIDNSEIPAVLHQSDSNKYSEKGVVILVHGIFSTKDERGRFIRQAKLHNEMDFDVIRFDFRGHGDHKIISEDITIGGMILDFHSVMKYAKSLNYKQIYVVASSFGASILLLYLQIKPNIYPSRIVLLNPLLDYNLTFFNPILPYAKNFFNEEGYNELETTGYITLEEGFKMNINMINEMKLLQPYEIIKELNIPTRIIHGDKDSKLPYSITQEYSSLSNIIDFQTIHGADHAFKPEADEKKSFELIIEWLYRGE